MTGFRLLLGSIVAAMAIYTAAVISDHGWNFLPIYLRDIAAMGWPGQFNVDFLAMLLLAATWIAWRGRFSASALLTALPVFVLGSPYFCLYLLLLISRTNGNMQAILLGEAAATARA